MYSHMCLQEKTQNYESLALGLRAAELPTEEKIHLVLTIQMSGTLESFFFSINVD